MRIITISRQFGSGGRELGKRLADLLGWDYYDREIIETLSQEAGLDPDYVHHTLDSHGWHNVQLTYRNSFSHMVYHPMGKTLQTKLLVRQREILQEIAQTGHDCIIVGRDADVILEEYHPFRMYICANMEQRLSRCMAHEQKRPKEQQLTEKEVRKNIRRIDRSRTITREILTGKFRGDSSTFDLAVNAGGRDLKQLSAALADFSLRWFENENCNG